MIVNLVVIYEGPLVVINTIAADVLSFVAVVSVSTEISLVNGIAVLESLDIYINLGYTF